MEDQELVPFLFPQFKIIDKIPSVKRPIKVIFKASPSHRPESLRVQLSFKSDEFLILYSNPSSRCDLVFDDNEKMLELVAERRHIRKTKDIVKRTKKLDTIEFREFVKKSLSLKRWYKEMFESKDKVYMLFQAMVESKMEFLKLYFRLCRHSSPEEILSSVLTFFERIEHYEEHKNILGDFYRRLVRRGKTQEFSLSTSIERLVFLNPEIPHSVKFLDFYLSLRG